MWWLAVAFLDGGRVSDALFGAGSIWIRQPEPARGFMIDLATAMLTVVSLVFSITIVTLTLASQQFGPLLIRLFMQRTSTQVTLGFFIALVVYCLLVACSIHEATEPDTRPFVPAFAIGFAVILTIVGVVLLVYFIHRVAIGIQAPVIVEEGAHDLDEEIDRLFPERFEEGAGEELGGDDGQAELATRELEARGEPRSVGARRRGYVQAVDDFHLHSLATSKGLAIRVLARPGDFVMDGEAIAHVWPREAGSAPIDRR
ncbi:MAG TPA: DUF2254 family protein, partial [Planctomycetota bacterium]|nr:DUF2254 family protein [Planctomycetota bacterium]